MEQITREEMIELLDRASGLLCFYGEDKTSLELDEATAALQAAEPVITVDIRRDPRDGSPNPRILKFADLGDGEHQLFALPCPPATELAPESWREELETIAEILEADGDEWNCAARIRKILKTSPAKAQVPEGWRKEWSAEDLSYLRDGLVESHISALLAGEVLPRERRLISAERIKGICVLAANLVEDLLAASPAPGHSVIPNRMGSALRSLQQSVEFLEQCKKENPDAATGAWKDAWDWVESAAISVVKAMSQEQEEASR